MCFRKSAIFMVILLVSNAMALPFDDMVEQQAEARASARELAMHQLGEPIRSANNFSETLTVKMVRINAGKSRRDVTYYYPQLKTSLPGKDSKPILSDSMLRPFGKTWTEFSVKPWTEKGVTISPVSVGIGQAYKKAEGVKTADYSYEVCLMYGYQEKRLKCEHVSLADIAKNPVTKVTIKIAATGEEAVVELSP